MNSQKIETTPQTGSDPEPAALTEDLALSLLNDRDLAAEDLDAILSSSALMKSRKVRLGVAGHPHTPRRIALRLIRESYTFDLMQFSHTPAVPADLKRFAEEQLVARLASVTLGERIALARRCSDVVAAALLLDKHVRVWQTALENPRLTEAAITKAMQRPHATPAFVEAVCHHPKWSLRSEIRLALLRSPHTPLACAIQFARRIPPAQLRDTLHASRLPERIKEYLQKGPRAGK